jgi:restriction endonuclease S subunit
LINNLSAIFLIDRFPTLYKANALSLRSSEYIVISLFFLFFVVCYSSAKCCITEEGLKKSNAKFFEAETTLIALVGATKGKTAYLTFKATTNQNIAGILSQDKSVIINHFIFYICRGMYQSLIQDLSAYDMLNLTQIKNIKIPVPPLTIQEKLVSEVEKLEQEISKNQKIVDEAPNLKQQVMKKYL